MSLADALHNIIYRRAGERLHADADDLAELRRAAVHEAGHLVLIEHVGAHAIGGARIFPDGSGHACDDVLFPDDTPIDCQIAVYLAGGMAQNVHLDHWACAGDKEVIRELLDELTCEQGIEAMHRARSIAKFGLTVYADRLDQLALRLERTGHG